MTESGSGLARPVPEQLPGTSVPDSRWCSLLHCRNPPQAKGLHYTMIKWLGRVGFVNKGMLYGILGGLLCRSAATGDKVEQSPQGVFIFVGTLAAGSTALGFMAAGCLLYAAWRYWEGLTGQGYSPDLKTSQNFFRYRLSPLVSGIIYSFYAYYIIQLLQRGNPGEASSANNADQFPESWRRTNLGLVGLILVAFSFTIALFTQAIQTFNGRFLSEMDEPLLVKYPFMRKVLNVMGRIGFFARGCAFAMVAILFWRIVFDEPTLRKDGTYYSPMSKAFEFLQQNGGGRTILFLIGIGLILYAIFAVLCAKFRAFPTQPIHLVTRENQGTQTTLQSQEADARAEARVKRTYFGAMQYLPAWMRRNGPADPETMPLTPSSSMQLNNGSSSEDWRNNAHSRSVGGSGAAAVSASALAPHARVSPLARAESSSSIANV